MHKITQNTLNFGTGKFAGSLLVQNLLIRDLGSPTCTGVGSCKNIKQLRMSKNNR